jgi:hypothetical protein
MSNFPQLNGQLGGNSLGKLNGQITATRDFLNGVSGSASINMNQGKPSLGGLFEMIKLMIF